MIALLDVCVCVCVRVCVCVSSVRRGHANLLRIVPTLTEDPRRESITLCCF